MKTLEQYKTIRDFLASQGMQPTTAMLATSDAEWADLLFLAEEWKQEIDAEIAAKEEELEGLSEEEIAFKEKLAEEERRLEQERVLFHSSGHRPGRK